MCNNNRKVWRCVSLKTAHAPLAQSTYAYLVKHYPDGRFAMSKHPAEGDTPEHWHIAGAFAKSVDCGWLRDAWMERDPHSYSDAGRSFNRCVRYLAHLDSPQKCKIDVSEVVHDGAWGSGEWDSVMRLPPDYNRIASILTDPENAGMKVTEMLSKLMVEGFAPRDVSGYCQALESVGRMMSAMHGGSK